MSARSETTAPFARAAPRGRGPDAADVACFVFDLDGTLSDTWPVALRAFRSALEGFAGRSFSDRELMALAGPAEEGILQQLFPDDWRTCFARYLESYRRELSNHEILFPGVFDLLQAMKRRGTTLAVNSGKTLAAVEMTLKQAGIEDDFALVLGGCAAGDRKAENLVDIAAHFGLERSRIAYVGDSASDMDAARTAGVLAIGAAWAVLADPAELAAADAEMVFEGVAAFRTWLRLPPA